LQTLLSVLLLIEADIVQPPGILEDDVPPRKALLAERPPHPHTRLLLSSLVTGTEEKSDKSALRENSGIVNLAGLDRQSLLRISIPSSHLPNRYSRAS